MTLGRYVHKETPIHRLDPRNKFLMLIIWMISIFMINPSKEGYETIYWLIYLAMGIFIVLIFKIAKLRIITLFQSLKPMWVMMVFLLIMNLFIYKGGPQLLPKWWIFDIHLEALIQTAKIVVRLALLISLSTIFTATTKPLDITVAIDDLFAWLKIFHLNVHILSMIISIALRFIPTILDETYRIMNAQASRGVDFKNGKLKEKVIAISSLIIPLFMSAISRSDELANAMEARNYNPLVKRTRFRQLKWKFTDTLTILFSILVLTTLIILSVLIKRGMI